MTAFRRLLQTMLRSFLALKPLRKCSSLKSKLRDPWNEEGMVWTPSFLKLCRRGSHCTRPARRLMQYIRLHTGRCKNGRQAFTERSERKQTQRHQMRGFLPGMGKYLGWVRPPTPTTRKTIHLSWIPFRMMRRGLLRLEPAVLLYMILATKSWWEKPVRIPLRMKKGAGVFVPSLKRCTVAQKAPSHSKRLTEWWRMRSGRDWQRTSTCCEVRRF
mmetsp:Transcript_2685/g.6018  ORF Transcript_2685/g.6018 Transcript_2685/m.6018 type:complete len:215 (+) Transcript_2685:712-1356(+)